MSFEKINELVKLSYKPLEDEELEAIDCEKHPYHRFLYYLVRHFKIKSALEIGTWQGVGAYHMAQAGAAVAAIDLNKPKYAYKFYFYQGDSCSKEMFENIKEFVDVNGKLQLVFQDSSHHYFSSKKEWEIYSELCADGAIWVCDDIAKCFHDPKIDPPGKNMLEYFKEIPRGKKWCYVGLHGETSGIGIVLL